MSVRDTLWRWWTAGLEKGGHNDFPDDLPSRPAPPPPMHPWGSCFPHFAVNAPMPAGTKPPRAYTDEQVRALADAMWQVLDDMGRHGLCLCPAAKAQARVAYEPFLQAEVAADPTLMPDYAPDMTFAEARAILDEVGL